MMQISRDITLLPAERLLREFLLECAESFPGLEIWVTGGWVRDRLLGIPSSDLDLSLSNITGKEFGSFLEQFSARPKVAAHYSRRAAELGSPDSLFTKFHIMKKNATMSKQLETAGGRLFGLDIDMVNLRKEVYDGQSRNPAMEFGTAEEDAFRRDATVNALFFHLQAQKVVDLTGRGFEDLEAKIMRTPLDPRRTFRDDPLRVLRLIRIAGRLGFTIDPVALACMKDPEIHQLLNTMITRDRVGDELFKMMKGAHPEAAFRHLFDADLYSPIFIRLNSPLVAELKNIFPPPSTDKSSPWPPAWLQSPILLSQILHQEGNLAKLVQYEKNVDFPWAMAAFAPLAGLRHSSLRGAVQEAGNAIRCSSKVSQLLESSLTNFDSIDSFVSLVATEGTRPRRSVLGMALRSWGETWTTQVLFTLLSQAVSIGYEELGKSETTESKAERSKSGTLLRKYTLFADFIIETELLDVASQRPLVNGNEIQTLFGLHGGGKYLKSILERLLEWQLDHADEEADAAKAWLLSNRAKLLPPQVDREARQ